MVNLKAIEGITSHISRNITSPFHHKTYGIVLNRKVHQVNVKGYYRLEGKFVATFVEY